MKTKLQTQLVCEYILNSSLKYDIKHFIQGIIGICILFKIIYYGIPVIYIVIKVFIILLSNTA